MKNCVLSRYCIYVLSFIAIALLGFQLQAVAQLLPPTIYVGGDPDFSVDITPDNVQIPAGTGSVIEITLRPINGFTGYVDITCNPACRFYDPNSGSANDSSTEINVHLTSNPRKLTVTLCIGDDVKPGDYEYTFTAVGYDPDDLSGSGGIITHVVPLNVTVEQAGSSGGTGTMDGGFGRKIQTSDNNQVYCGLSATVALPTTNSLKIVHCGDHGDGVYIYTGGATNGVYHK